MHAKRLLPRLIALALLLLFARATASEAGAGEGGEQARLLELRREIARHDELYFKRAAPVISDFEYDALKAELRVLEVRLGQSPVDSVGDDRDGQSPTHRHLAPMLSLEKAHSDEEVSAYAARVEARLGGGEAEYRVEPKYDGVAVSLTYERGRLLRAATRGNGVEGDDITANILAVRGVPAGLRADPAATWPERVELRGELIVSAAEFARANEERAAAGEPAFANARNLAAGSIRLRDTTELASRGLEFVCFGWGAWEPAESRPATLGEFRARLAAWGLPAVADTRTARGAAGLVAATQALRSAGARGGFPTDGVVVKLERVADHELLGFGPAAPRWALARKFAPERAATRLLGITWQVGRTGVLTPVAELAAVELGGSTISRATLHNAEEIARRDLRVGDRVFVEKAGEIIPALVAVDLVARAADSAPYVFPQSCPACAAPLTARADGSGAALRCENEVCSARLARRIEHLAGPQALAISGLGPALVEALVASGKVHLPADLFGLGEADWRALPGMGAKSAESLAGQIEAARQRARADGARLLFALGWPGVGRETARRLAAAYPGLPALAAAGADEWRTAAGLGSATAAGLASYLASPLGQAELVAWSERGIGGVWSQPEPTAAARGPLAGEVVVLTGTLGRWTRAEATARLRAAGAEVAGDLTRRTTLVVAGAEPGAKLAEARARGVVVIDEAELAKRLGE